MSLTWNPRLVKTPTPIMSAMTTAVAVGAVARFELPLLAGIIGYLPRESLLIVAGPFVAQAGKEFDAAHPTLTTGVHFGLDDGDGFFNPASCAFAVLPLSACSLPSIGATCGGSLSRYGRPIPSSFSCASIHFHKISLHVHLSARVSPFTLTRSTASPWP